MMATLTTGKATCFTCSKLKIVYSCDGCKQKYCFEDLNKHRILHNQEIETIPTTCNEFRQKLIERQQTVKQHPIFQEVERWREDSIQKINQTADECTSALFDRINNRITTTNRALDEFIKELMHIREEDQFNEIHLTQLKEKLAQLEHDFDHPLDIQIQQEPSSFIRRIFVERTTDEPCSPTMVNSSAGLIIPQKQFHTNSSTSDINILLLGQTGVGKSTFINALANYFLFNTCEEAIGDDMQALIPFSFTYTSDETFEQDVINVGKSDEFEHLTKAGDSTTQLCHSFVFSVGNRLLRIIDTPSVLDTRGFEQDQKNIHEIVSYISHYEHLNAICILLKANQTIDVSLQYCLPELLRLLPKAAMKNIIFIFTNARSTFYRFATTWRILLDLLDDLARNFDVRVPCSRSNAFLLDNEGLHYLAIIKKKLQVCNSDKLDYSCSWNNSTKECTRLFRRIITNPPTATQHTTTLYEAQQSLHILNKQLSPPAIFIDTSQCSDKISNEQRKIENICRQLSEYLRINAILPFNDHIPNYVRHICHEERRRHKNGAQNADEIHRLEQLFSTYENEIELIKRTIQDDMNSTEKIELIKAEEITHLVTDLFNLPIHGSDIRRQFEELRLSAMINKRRDITVNLPTRANDSLVMSELKQIFSRVQHHLV